jgi:hypothetical protein
MILVFPPVITVLDLAPTIAVLVFAPVMDLAPVTLRALIGFIRGIHHSPATQAIKTSIRRF